MVNWLQWFIGYNGLLVTMVSWESDLHSSTIHPVTKYSFTCPAMSLNVCTYTNLQITAFILYH